MKSATYSVTASRVSEEERKRKMRRTALWLALLAVTFYLGFIALNVLRN